MNRGWPALAPLVSCLAVTTALAQNGDGKAEVRRLFREDTPLVLTLNADFREVSANRDTINKKRFAASLTFPGDSGPQSITVELATRGHFRLRSSTCGFPPLRVFFPKDQIKGTPFAGNGSLKLVTHCDKNQRYEQNLLVEYGIYRALNRLTDWSHRARLVHVTYADSRDSTKNLTRWGFFLEADKDVAKRNGGQLFKSFGTYSEMDSTQMDLVGVFQYLIGNTDWSVIMGHNIELVQIPGQSVLYPVPYDFDFSGLVDASYARPDPRMPIKSVRQRLYRGMCRTPERIAPVLARMLAARDPINRAFATLPDLDPKRLKDVQKYLDDGFKAFATPKNFMPEQEYVCSKTRE